MSGVKWSSTCKRCGIGCDHDYCHDCENRPHIKQYLVSFRAEYYCQGYEWSTFSRLVDATSFGDACNKIKELKTNDWEKGTPCNFKNNTI